MPLILSAETFPGTATWQDSSTLLGSGVQFIKQRVVLNDIQTATTVAPPPEGYVPGAQWVTLGPNPRYTIILPYVPENSVPLSASFHLNADTTSATVTDASISWTLSTAALGVINYLMKDQPLLDPVLAVQPAAPAWGTKNTTEAFISPVLSANVINGLTINTDADPRTLTAFDISFYMVYVTLPTLTVP